MLSVLIVCRQIDDFLLRTIKSVEELKPQILVDVSADGKKPLGVRKNRLISESAYEWVLILDTDEVVSVKLRNEINDAIKKTSTDVHGYEIPYQNYIFGQPVHYGGEKYSWVQFFF